MRCKRKGYVKIHGAVSVKSKQVVSLEVTDDKTSDGKMLPSLVKKAQRKAKVKGVLGDGATTPMTPLSSWQLLGLRLDQSAGGC